MNNSKKLQNLSENILSKPGVDLIIANSIWSRETVKRPYV
jgi:hypothetical protein